MRILVLAISIPFVLSMCLDLVAQTPIFRAPVPLPSPINLSTSREGSPKITADLLTLYFKSDRSGGLGGFDVWMSTRPDLTKPWNTPVNVKALNSILNEQAGPMRTDGLEIIFVSERSGSHDLYDAHRTKPTGTWTSLRRLPGAPTSNKQGGASMTGDGLELYFMSAHTGSSAIYRMTRTSYLASWSSPVAVSEISVPTAGESTPGISPDGLVLVFSSKRSGGAGMLDLWIAGRSSRTAKFGTPALIKELNSTVDEAGGNWTHDGFSLYFRRSGDILRADRILPICIPTGLPTRGQPFDIACRRDPGDLGIVVGSLAPMPPTRIPGSQGFLAIHPAFIVWNAVGKIGNIGRFTTRAPIPDVPALKGVPLHWQAGAQDSQLRVFISPPITTAVQ